MRRLWQRVVAVSISSLLSECIRDELAAINFYHLLDLYVDDPGSVEIDDLFMPAQGIVRSVDDVDKLLASIGADLATLTADIDAQTRASVKMLDAVFDIIDSSGDGKINRNEFFEFFTRSLNAPENKPPRQIIISRGMTDKVFLECAGLGGDNIDDDLLDKNEFVALMMQKDAFRAMIFLAIAPDKTCDMSKPSLWKPITLDQFKAFMARNKVSSLMQEVMQQIFLDVAGPDRLLEYEELDKAVKLATASRSGKTAGQRQLKDLGKVGRGASRSHADTESVLAHANADFLKLSEDVRRNAMKSVKLIDTMFDIMDPSGDGEINHKEFVNFMQKSLDSPGNQPPKQFVLNQQLVDQIFSEIAATGGDAGADQIDKNEFTLLMLQKDFFRKILFFLINPDKRYNIKRPGTWSPIDVKTFHAFLLRNKVEKKLVPQLEQVFLDVASPDRVLEFKELDSAIKAAKQSAR